MRTVIRMQKIIFTPVNMSRMKYVSSLPRRDLKVMRLITADYAISPAYPRLPAGDPSERGETIFCIGTKVNLPKKRTYTPLYLSDHNF